MLHATCLRTLCDQPLSPSLCQMLKQILTSMTNAALLPSLPLKPRVCRAAAVRCCKQQQQFAPGPVHFEKQQRLFISKARISHKQHLCTLCSQLSLDRWPRWAQQADSWGGPLSVAVYVPAPRNTPAADAYLEATLKLAEAHSARHPEQPLVLSALFSNHYAREGVAALQDLPGITAEQHPLLDPGAAHTPTYDQLYPINALRNLAVAEAATPLVLSADGDFIFSQGLQDNMSSPAMQKLMQYQVGQPSQLLQQVHDQYTTLHAKGDAKALMQKQQEHSSQLQQPHHHQLQQLQSETNSPVMLVLPAFQLATQGPMPDKQAAVVPRTKADLTQALEAGIVEPFHCGAFPPKQQPIVVETWLTASTAFEVQYCEGFEPQGVAVKQQLPQYDEAFRGYGLNKVQHAWHMAQLKYTFKVLPDAFMVTFPHKRSSSWRPTPGTYGDEAHLSRIKSVYQLFKKRLQEQIQASGGV